MRLIAGLGNPGRRFTKTRHNVGFMLIDRLAKRGDSALTRFGSTALTARMRLAEQDLLLLKPQTYMNLSGTSVRELIRYFGLDVGESLIVYDDVALPLGKIRFRASGSSGGHKGMQSIIEHLGTIEIPRLRIGIAGDRGSADLAGYVLDRFTGSEIEVLTEVLGTCEQAVEYYLLEGIDRAMARFN